jgi:hypothetical protein
MCLVNISSSYRTATNPSERRGEIGKFIRMLLICVFFVCSEKRNLFKRRWDRVFFRVGQKEEKMRIASFRFVSFRSLLSKDK